MTRIDPTDAQFYLDNRKYAGGCANVRTGHGSSDTFDLACDTPSDTTYTVTVTGMASQGMDLFVYGIDQNNKKTTTGVAAGWSAGPGDCWVTRKDGTCG